MNVYPFFNRGATMCGILALVQTPEQPVDMAEIRRACSLMEHLGGPDQLGLFVHV